MYVLTYVRCMFVMSNIKSLLTYYIHLYNRLIAVCVYCMCLCIYTYTYPQLYTCFMYMFVPFIIGDYYEVCFYLQTCILQEGSRGFNAARNKHEWS